MRKTAKVFGLVLVATISVLAVTAVAAQAEEMQEGSTRVEGKVLTFKETISFEGKGGESEFFVPGLNLKIICTAEEVKGEGGNYILNVKGEKELGLHSHTTTLGLFSGCKVVASSCIIYPTEADFIEGTNAGKIHAIGLGLSLGKSGVELGYALLKGNNGLGNASAGAFTKYIYAGAKCTLPEEIEITGSMVLMIPLSKTEAVEHTAEDISIAEEKTLKETMSFGLSYGAEPAEITKGSVTSKLTGTFAGKKFSSL